MSRKIIMGPEDIRRTLARISHEIIERNKSLDRLVLVGIHTRGVPLARRLAENIRRFEGQPVAVGSLDFSRHRDDLACRATPSAQRTQIPGSIDDRTVVLVDDVLHTGRSIRATMDTLVELGRPRQIQLAVLIDRGHREMPIRADYIGKNIPSSREEEIQVNLVETDGTDEVAIISLDNGERVAGGPQRSGYGAEK